MLPAAVLRERCELARYYNTLIFPYRLSRFPGDTDEKVVQEVGAASEAQHSVGQLEGEVSRLAELTSWKKGDRI